jgi:hypothetical protein
MPLNGRSLAGLGTASGRYDGSDVDRYGEILLKLTEEVQGHNYAAIYLCGYAAEMLLKVASFRFDGALPGDSLMNRRTDWA